MTFFSTIADRDRRGPVDDNLLLRDISDGAETTDAEETGIALNMDAVPNFRVCISISAVAGTTDGSNYWTINVQVSDALAGTYTTIGTLQASGSAEKADLAFTRSQIESLDADAAYIRTSLTETGTTATSITYGAWVMPS